MATGPDCVNGVFPGEGARKTRLQVSRGYRQGGPASAAGRPRTGKRRQTPAPDRFFSLSPAASAPANAVEGVLKEALKGPQVVFGGAPQGPEGQADILRQFLRGQKRLIHRDVVFLRRDAGRENFFRSPG